jgi:hypothetical protein
LHNALPFSFLFSPFEASPNEKHEKRTLPSVAIVGVFWENEKGGEKRSDGKESEASFLLSCERSEKLGEQEKNQCFSLDRVFTLLFSVPLSRGGHNLIPLHCSDLSQLLGSSASAAQDKGRRE